MLGRRHGETAWATSIVGGFQATSKGSGNHSWNGHVPVAIWAKAHLAHLGGETDMHHGAEIIKIRARAAASQQETMTPRPGQGCPRRLRRPHRDESRYRTIQAP